MPPPREPDPPADDAREPPPHLDESVRRIGAAGRASLDSALETGRALRKLVVADLALARSALGRALAWTGVAIVFGASSWLLLMAAAIALLQAWGWSWLAASAICAGLSLAVTVLAAWRVSCFFDHAGMHATRRQLRRLGIGDDDEEEQEAATAPKPEPPAA
ncbi:phage holin family protein [Luteimonas cucumeris]|uniref:phage holin family protein n=1 Tax=Luteimonas cucumeris TaxID=985012 RepID=UPI0011A282B8|nr:phage holin family protein [Luteimonas cucumeris]